MSHHAFAYNSNGDVVCVRCTRPHREILNSGEMVCANATTLAPWRAPAPFPGKPAVDDWPVPQWIDGVHPSVELRRLATLYAELRDVCTKIGMLQGEAWPEDDRPSKQLDFAHVFMRCAYKRIKKVLTEAGAECGRRKLKQP